MKCQIILKMRSVGHKGLSLVGIMIKITFPQVMTTLKDTSKPVADVPFPALTICGSGVHMNNVERKLILDFQEWRLQENRNGTTKDAIKKDTEEFMQTRFQIKPSQTEQEHPLNILDILDTMIAPDVDPFFDANSIRENVIACEEATHDEENNLLLHLMIDSCCLERSASMCLQKKSTMMALWLPVKS